MTWALATTHPNIESRVASSLADAGLHLQLFFVKTMTVVRGVLTPALRPAFPRYLFVRAEERWREILEISGVSGFLTNEEGYPAKIDNMVVDGLLARSVFENNKIILNVPPRQSRFKFGDSVQIIGNSLISGRKGMFQHLTGDVHAALLVEVMGRFISFRVPESELVLIPMRVPRKNKRHKWNKPSREGLARTSALISPA